MPEHKKPEDKKPSIPQDPSIRTTSQQAIGKMPVFLVGAGLGLIAAYLLDPEHGAKRRQTLAGHGARASEKGVKHLNHGWRDVIHRFSGFLHDITRKVHLTSPESPTPPKKESSTSTESPSH